MEFQHSLVQSIHEGQAAKREDTPCATCVAQGKSNALETCFNSVNMQMHLAVSHPTTEPAVQKNEPLLLEEHRKCACNHMTMTNMTAHIQVGSLDPDYLDDVHNLCKSMKGGLDGGTKFYVFICEACHGKEKHKFPVKTFVRWLTDSLYIWDCDYQNWNPILMEVPNWKRFFFSHTDSLQYFWGVTPSR